MSVFVEVSSPVGRCDEQQVVPSITANNVMPDVPLVSGKRAGKRGPTATPGRDFSVGFLSNADGGSFNATDPEWRTFMNNAG